MKERDHLLNSLKQGNNTLIEYHAGRYASAWSFICESAGSSYLHSCENTKSFIDTFQHLQDSDKRPTYIDFELLLTYKVKLKGPILSTILLSYNSIESFLRLYYQLLIDTRNKKARSDGIDSVIEQKLIDFDKYPFREKYNKVLEMAYVEPLHPELIKRLEALCFFRNDCTHDDALLDTYYGSERVKGGKLRRHKRQKEVKFHRELYPLLISSNYPVRLSHVINAVYTHDTFVNHVLTTTPNAHTIGELLEVTGVQTGWRDSSGPWLISDTPLMLGWEPEAIISLANYWEDPINKYVESISLKDHLDFGIELKTKGFSNMF